MCEKIGSGATPRGGSDVYLPSAEVSLIRSQNIYNTRFHRDGLVYLTPRHAEELSNVEVMENDVLLNITGDSVARCCQVPTDVLPARVNQHVAIIRPKPDLLDPRFLSYWLVSPAMQEYMLQLAGAGATRNALTKGMIEAFQVPGLPLPEQRAIARILGSLDDKIDLNRRINETLEAMARAMFRSWFVDFDPVRAEVKSRKPEGMDAATAKLFPDKVADSPLGPVPKGWESVRFGDLVTVLSGGTPSMSVPGYWGGSIPWLTAKDMKTARIVDTEDHVTQEGAENGTRLVPAGSVLMLVRGMTLHKDLPICLATRPMTFNQDVKAICARDIEYRDFIYLWLLDNKEALLGVVDAASHGTGRIHTHLITERPVVKPPLNVIAAFNRIVRSFLQRAIVNDEECVTLAALRDALLPKLLSGEVGVSDQGHEVIRRSKQ